MSGVSATKTGTTNGGKTSLVMVDDSTAYTHWKVLLAITPHNLLHGTPYYAVTQMGAAGWYDVGNFNHADGFESAGKNPMVYEPLNPETVALRVWGLIH